MDFEPEKFFIGLIDFFSILLPGALLTYLLKDDLGPTLLGPRYDRLADTEGWMVFLFSSYLLGHFIFLIGAWLLDDHVYDPIRKATYQEQIRRLAKGEKLSWRLNRILARWLIKKDADNAVNLAVRVKEHNLDQLNGSSAINAFQWCKARLTLEHPKAMATVQRFEADSKFFRSLLIVLCILIPIGLVESRPIIAYISAGLMILAFWRYLDQRLKATSQAYWYVITLEGQREDGYRQPAVQAQSQSHAGGVVYHGDGDRVEYILVQSRKSANEWVLPKGHIEPGERMQETAVREVREEAGVWACIRAELNPVSLVANGEQIETQFYLMEAVGKGKPSDPGRKHAWLPLSQALEQATYPETRELLRLSEQKRSRPMTAVT